MTPADATPPSWPEGVPLPVPNLVIMGAQKSGTTSLHRALGRHPQVHMSRPLKEATYFYPEEMLETRLARYGHHGIDTRDKLVRQLMLKDAKQTLFFGESSTDYTVSDRARALGIPARMAALSPGLRFIYILRHPFDRILSAQRHMLATSGTDPFAALAAGDLRNLNYFLLTSLYGYQLSAYLDLFPRDRFHLVAYEDFAADQTAVLRHLHDVLGLTRVRKVVEVHRNVSPDATYAATERLPRAILDLVHTRVTEDMDLLRHISGFDTARWDLAYDTWRADA